LLISEPSVAKGFIGWGRSNYPIRARSGSATRGVRASDRDTHESMVTSLRERLSVASAAASASGRSPTSPRAPLVLGPSLVDVLQDDGETLANALRRRADAVIAAQRAVAAAGAEIVLAPTTCTTAPALHATGQAYRAAALTAVAIDLSRDGVLAARSDAYVVGEVPAKASQRWESEARTHVERLASAAADGVLVRAESATTTRVVAETARVLGLPAIVEVEAGRLDELGSALDEAAGIVVRCAQVEEIAAALEAARRHSRLVGARVMVSGENAQLVAAHAWGVMASLEVSFLAVGGSAALTTLPALVDLARAPRVTIV
jgi:hypothetical protein